VISRDIVWIAEHCFAATSCTVNGRLERVFFALPPDAEPTPRLWMTLERVLIARIRKLPVPLYT
jgi:hypothetical protein